PSVRRGYGLFWNFTPGGPSSSKAQNQPFLQAQTYTTQFGTNLQLQNGLPPPPGVHPELPPVGTTRSAFDKNFRDGYAHNFNVNVQRQFSDKYMAEVAYSGSLARNMTVKTDFNQAPPILGVTNQNINRPWFATDPGLSSVGALQSSGYLNYSGLLTKFQRSLANPFSFLVAYTYAKAVDLDSNNDGGVTLTNIFDPGYNKGPAEYDVRHSFSTTWIYELPWAAQTAWGGWQLSGIVHARSGLPVTITQSGTMASTGITNNRPNTICDPSLSSSTIDQWFNTSCFQRVTEGTATFGNTGRDTVRGPGSVNIDASLIKNTRFGHTNAEVRLEVFNVLNHPQFANPATVLGGANF